MAASPFPCPFPFALWRPEVGVGHAGVKRRRVGLATPEVVEGAGMTLAVVAEVARAKRRRVGLATPEVVEGAGMTLAVVAEVARAKRRRVGLATPEGV